MTAYILRRLAQLIPVLFLASLGIWAMVYAVPGSPVGAIVGENATPEQIADTIKRLGLDRPLYEQYWTWLRGAVVGDFGQSIQSREPVLDLILTRVPATLQLGLAAIIVGQQPGDLHQSGPVLQIGCRRLVVARNTGGLGVKEQQTQAQTFLDRQAHPRRLLLDGELLALLGAGKTALGRQANLLKWHVIGGRRKLPT